MIFVNKRALEVDHFTNTECRVRELDDYILNSENVVEMRCETEREDYNVNEDLILLLFVRDELRRKNQNARLVIMCMPYQRMDRKCAGDIFTLESIAKYINWLEFSEVFVVEPHSKKTLELLNCSFEISPIAHWIPVVKEKVGFTDDDYIVFPDGGAKERYEKYHLGKKICYFKKRRNNTTNDIKVYELVGASVEPGRKCIIVDDLCSKGDTLYHCCEKLAEYGIDEVYVIVSHCEAIALKNPIFLPTSNVKKFFTSRSSLSVKNDKIEYLDVVIK